jgi:peptidyl-prolyl cis-trans isomerase C
MTEASRFSSGPSCAQLGASHRSLGRERGNRLLPAPALAALLIGFLPWAGLSSCRVVTEDSAAEPVLAKINGETVTESQFRSFQRLNFAEMEGEAAEVPREDVFREFVLERLLLQEARKQGISVDGEEVEEQLRSWLHDSQDVPPELRTSTRDFLIAQRLIRGHIGPNLQITAREMEEYYEARKEIFVVDDFARVLEIMVHDPEQASEIRKQLRERDFNGFRRIAREQSRAMSAQSGGQLGGFQRGDLPEEFEKVIFALKPGGISPVFPSGHGYHIFMMQEFVPRHPQALHEVQETIFEELMAEKERKAISQFINEKLLSASIEIYDENLRLEWRNANVEISP